MQSSAIAIVGMAGRFPGARSVSQFWQNLSDGVESIRSLSDAELLANNVSPEELANPDYVKRASVLDDVPMFDASFFGLSPRDASIMDPQHRHFLECAWEALEDAGHPPRGFDGSIGVFAGSGMNTYLIHNLLANRSLLESAGLFQLKQTGNDKDVLATRVSYQLDLRGPSVNVQTACSTSLVAVHIACQSLLNHECDMALAGGVTIEFPHGQGYLYREGEILSRDGHCRSFDAASSGTVFGSGLGIVILRRLDDALADRDHIRALILGSTINNDGARKVGYLAPSVEGQAEVISEALEVAGVSADDISYVEAHGTGTVVGDPIEVRALTQAFRRSTTRSGYCGIGSLKSNVGHLDAAAGIGGLIKAVLALEHAHLPPTLHFQNLNPHIEVKNSPFFINSKLVPWPVNGKPRRAGVTALGIGGTNAHVVLEEAPPTPASRRTRPYQVLTVSGKSEAATEQAWNNLAAHLRAHPETSLADVAFTCQLGRHGFPFRRAEVVEDSVKSKSALATEEHRHLVSAVVAKVAPSVVFMFSGQGSQYVNMGRELYESEPVFRDCLDFCAQRLLEHVGVDLRQALYPSEQDRDKASERLNQTWLTQPALFALEYCLARWWISLGIEPSAMVGHSIGEYVAACLAGVFSVEDALAIVSYRGRCIYGLPSGSMLAVSLPAAELNLDGTLSLAAVNSPRLCVVSGPTDAIASFEETLAKKSIVCRRLFTSHAFHSEMMDPILESFESRMSNITLHAPCIPYLSNVSGTWIKAEEATDPTYWARHIRQTVLFSDCLSELLRKPERIIIEVGPGNTLTALARQQGGPETKAFQSLPHPRETISDVRCALETLAHIWTLGANVNWVKMHPPGSAQRVSLPTYPFEHQKFWIEPDKVQTHILASPEFVAKPDDGKELSFYRRLWKAAPVRSVPISEVSCWIIFNDSLGLGDRIASKLRGNKQEVILVAPGIAYKYAKKGKHTIRPAAREDYDALISELIRTGYRPRKVLHLWSMTPGGTDPPLEETLDRCFYSPLHLVQALAVQDVSDLDIAFISNRMQQVSEEPVRNPARAVLLGPARVIPKELPGITCRSVDVDLEKDLSENCATQIIAELESTRENATLAFRNGERFVETLEQFRLEGTIESQRLERRGVYLITGGLGGIGLVVAEHLAHEFNAQLVLVSRSAFPPEEKWETCLNDAQETEADKQKIRKLIAIRSSAGGLMVVQADVTNLDQMRGVIELAREHYGRIDGVFHAAGVIEDSPLMLKSTESAARVLAPKVKGTLVLEEALGDAPLSFFVLFSSISSILPPAGQVDYAAANAFLDAFALSRKERVTVLNWGAWSEVGMGARSASQHPWLEQCLIETPVEIAYKSQFSLEKQWLLAEHRLKSGKALFPGTGYLEIAAAAFSRGSFRSALEFQDVFFLTPLTFDSNESREVRVQLKRESNGKAERGAFQFSVFARTEEWVEYARGQIAPCKVHGTLSVNRSSIRERCNEQAIVFDELHRTRQEHYFDFGPRWRCLKRIFVGRGEGLAEVELDAQFAGDSSSFHLHPALLDLATGCSLYLTDGYEQSDDLYLPFSYKRMSVYDCLPPRFFSHIRPSQANHLKDDVLTFDLTLFDEGGRVISEVEGFTLRRMADPGKAKDKSVWRKDAFAAGAEASVESYDSPGIEPCDGVRALRRLLQTNITRAVVVVTMPFDRINKRESVPAPRALNSASSPGQSVERTLTEWWQEMLGVKSVGLDDDFFALGGHSLVGVRLFTKIKRMYGVDLQLKVLFEARTVRQLAEKIRGDKQPGEIGMWPHLTALQPKGSHIPLFFPHAIGGDVLFYEPLSKALGAEQPFYAFRSPLLSQEEVQEASIEELASLYVKELRAFFPQGPYLLAGASLGGIIAFEMSRQLSAQGSQPAFLLLIDAKVPKSAQHFEVREQINRFWKSLASEGFGYPIRKLHGKSGYLWTRLVERTKRSVCSAYRLAGKSLPTSLHLFEAEDAHKRALSRYVFRTYPGKVTLIRALDRGNSLSERDHLGLGWRGLVEGELDVREVRGGHVSMLSKPDVDDFAELIKSLLPS